MDIIRIPIKNYIHVRDNMSGVTYMVEGPITHVLKSHETLKKAVTAHVQLGKSQYITIKNPVLRDDKNNLLYEDFGNQVKLQYGSEEIRTDKEYSVPFPLYPGEEAVGNVTAFLNVSANEEIKLKCVRPFFDDLKNKNRKPGDLWMLRGQISYVPRVEAVLLEKIYAVIIRPNHALKVSAKTDCVDKYGNKRMAGEQWLIREAGSYLPNVEEEIVGDPIKGITITDKLSLHLKAKCDFKDVYTKNRLAGEEWLITLNEADMHIVDVNEILVKNVPITVLSSREYCNIINPMVDNQTHYGQRVQRRGEASFFLQPREILEGGIQKVVVLDENDALLLKANQNYKHGEENRKSGDRWMIRGPCEFVLPLELTLLEKRRAIPLDDNEGIYVRNLFTGEIKMITGQTYLLTASEELWQKELSTEIENLLLEQSKTKSSVKRDKSRVVTYRAPHNSVVQVYDFRSKNDRIVFGPELIKLGPHEEFTVLRLSGKKPKVENAILSLSIILGPDFMTDIIEVETRDHARLKVQLCYSWRFIVDQKDLNDCRKIFTVNDFVGDACKNLAAKIRGAVSTVTFENFHNYSQNLVKTAVFGTDENNIALTSLKFESNNLLITNVDIQSQEPCDEKTRDNLSQSTDLSIQFINQSQKDESDHKQLINTEESQGKLKLQKLEDDTHAERENTKLLIKKVATEAVKTSGDLTARAHAIAKGNEIQGNSLIDQAKLKVQALDIEVLSSLIEEEENIKEDIKKKEQIVDLELEKLTKLSQIEVEEFQKTIQAIGKETIIAMAKAGPETQAKLLKSLGIKSFLISDGKNPINLFNTAKGILKKSDSKNDSEN
jgi:major vault protein